jgi:50S ribosomal protein L16 3-hydroxylase
LSPRAFAAAAARRGLRLDASTLLLYDGRWIFINGAAIARPRSGAPVIERLANARATGPRDGNMGAPHQLVYRWYCDGYLHLE